MKNTIAVITITLMILSKGVFAQSQSVEYKAGHSFNISLPDYMSKTSGLNSAATIQYKNAVKDVYGFVIFDTKEELSLVDMNFASIDEFYEEFIKDFLKDQKNRQISKPESKTIGEYKFIQSDASYYDEDVKGDIYYLVGVVETKKTYYKVLSWVLAENKNKFKEDFQKILYSIRD
ncbi:hypothetical protein [Daejeonella oryzae]|uniref:hypothetical protein n=1 Tax=Daejeonella oryzae TaxID=1122943 RepID=UPI0004009A5F|nr:hypothetical protein [Daejeonella oryzae]